MFKYKIVLEDIDDARKLKDLLEEVGDTYASVNARRGEVIIDSSASIAQLCEIMKDEGYDIIDLELL